MQVAMRCLVKLVAGASIDLGGGEERTTRPAGGGDGQGHVFDRAHGCRYVGVGICLHVWSGRTMAAGVCIALVCSSDELGVAACKSRI